jgi:hypothetical protein
MAAGKQIVAFILLLALGISAVLASITFLNVVRLEVNAALPPVSKNLNLLVYPLASARWVASDIYNVTYYGVKFVPGWPELYLVKGPDGRSVGFVGSTTYTTAGPYTIDPGQCIDIGAYVAIDPAIPPHLADGRTVLGQYQVNIVMEVLSELW